jgi:hypothetical protein
MQQFEAELREQIAKEIEAYVIEKENALGMQMIAARIARGNDANL